MRRKGEGLFECLERKGFVRVSGPMHGNYSTTVPGGFYSVHQRGDEVFVYGIKDDGNGPYVGPYGPIPKCCSEYVPLFTFPSLPPWIKWCLSIITGERRRQRKRKAHRDSVLAWLRMDINAEIVKTRKKLASE